MTSARETFGLACPVCKRDDGIVILATEYVRLVPDGTVSAGDQEWALDSPAHCMHCGHDGIVAEYDSEAEATSPVPLMSPPGSKASLPNDVLCELAHELTIRECSFKQILVDSQDTGDDETHYSDQAQDVFDAVYGIISDVLEPYREERAQ